MLRSQSETLTDQVHSVTLTSTAKSLLMWGLLLTLNSRLVEMDVLKFGGVTLLRFNAKIWLFLSLCQIPLLSCQGSWCNPRTARFFSLQLWWVYSFGFVIFDWSYFDSIFWKYICSSLCFLIFFINEFWIRNHIV